MKTFIKISLSLISFILISFIIWFSWGSYSKNHIKNLLDHNFYIPDTKLSYDKITLSGFPFNFCFNIINLESENHNGTKIKFPKIHIDTNFTIKKFNITFGKELFILYPDSPLLTVRFKDPAHVSATLYSSALTLLLTSAQFNLTDIRALTYTDYGFSVSNAEKHEKIFISNANSIKIQSFLTLANEYNFRITSSLKGQGSFYQNTKMQGENLLNTDIIFSINTDKNFHIHNMNVNFVKCALSSDYYTTNISGHMNYKQHFGFNGQVNVNIHNIQAFFDFIGSFINNKSTQKWGKILNAMSGQSNNISFRIAGDNNQIRWGKLSDHELTKMLVQQ